MPYLSFVIKSIKLPFMKKTVILIAVLFLLNNIYAQTASKWRGPDGTGIYPEKDLLKVWPKNGPEIIWVFNGLDKGHSSPVLANDKIYLTTMIDTTGYLIVLNQEGKLIKKVAYGTEWFESFEGARSTPTVVGDLIYIFSAKGKLICMNLQTYEIRWEKNVFKDFDGVNIRWGVTETILIDGDILYCSPGGQKNNVIALNRNTGELIWSCAGKGGASAYCTPLLVEMSGRKLLVTIMSNNILGIDAKSGALLWSYPKSNRWDVHANTPMYSNGGLYCFAGYGVGGIMLKLSENGSSVTELWKNESLDNKMGGAILLDGYIYGSGDKYKTWKCLSWETGEQKWESKEIARGVVISADGLLYCYSDKGELALVKPNSKKFDIISKTKVKEGNGPHWAHPVINKGRLYIRHGDALIAYKIK